MRSLFVICLVVIVEASGIGVKGGLLSSNMGIGASVGLFGMIDAGDVLTFRPCLNIEYIGSDTYWDGREWIDRFNIYELNVSLDALFKFSNKAVVPYVGVGIVPTVDIEDYEDAYYDRSQVLIGLGFNFVGGVMFPMGTYKGSIEVEGIVGIEKQIGVNFSIIFERHASARSYHKQWGEL